MAGFGPALDPMEGFKQYADYLQKAANAGIAQQKLKEAQRDLAMRPDIAKGIGTLALGGQQAPQLPPPPQGLQQVPPIQQGGMTVPPGQPSQANAVPGMRSGVPGAMGSPGMQPGWQGLPKPPQQSPVQPMPPQAPPSMGVNLGEEWKRLKAAGLGDEAAVGALAQYHQLLAPEDKMALQMMQYELQRQKAVTGEKLAREKMSSQQKLLEARIESAEKIAQSRDYTQMAVAQARIEGALTGIGMRESGKDKDRALKEKEIQIKADWEKARAEAMDALKDTRKDKVAVDKLKASMTNLTKRKELLMKQQLLADTDEDKAMFTQQIQDIDAMIQLHQQKLDLVGMQSQAAPSGAVDLDEVDKLVQ